MSAPSAAATGAASHASIQPGLAILVLAALLSIQPVTTDLYLPALPALTRSLGAPLSAAQLTLSGLLLAFGCSQMVWGPLSDRFGRRPILLVGLAIYAVASLGSALAPSMALLIAWRVAQGAAMGAVVMCARAIVRDLYTPQEGARAMSKALTGLGIVACVRDLREPFEARGWPALSIGVGVSTGTMNVGNMGSEFHTAYTVLGDTVNLGSRLEGLTKQYGVDIIVSGPTAAAVPDYLFRELDRVRVKGKNEPVAILEPIGPRDGVAAGLLEEVSRFAQMLEHYRAQRWHEALDILVPLARSDARPLYEMYLERIARCRAFPPPRDSP